MFPSSWSHRRWAHHVAAQLPPVPPTLRGSVPVERAKRVLHLREDCPRLRGRRPVMMAWRAAASDREGFRLCPQCRQDVPLLVGRLERWQLLVAELRQWPSPPAAVSSVAELTTAVAWLAKMEAARPALREMFESVAARQSGVVGGEAEDWVSFARLFDERAGRFRDVVSSALERPGVRDELLRRYDRACAAMVVRTPSAAGEVWKRLHVQARLMADADVAAHHVARFDADLDAARQEWAGFLPRAACLPGPATRTFAVAELLGLALRQQGVLLVWGPAYHVMGYVAAEGAVDLGELDAAEMEALQSGELPPVVELAARLALDGTDNHGTDLLDVARSLFA